MFCGILISAPCWLKRWTYKWVSSLKATSSKLEFVLYKAFSLWYMNVDELSEVQTLTSWLPGFLRQIATVWQFELKLTSPTLQPGFSVYDIASTVREKNLLLRSRILQCVLCKNLKIASKYPHHYQPFLIKNTDLEVTTGRRISFVNPKMKSTFNGIDTVVCRISQLFRISDDRIFRKFMRRGIVDYFHHYHHHRYTKYRYISFIPNFVLRNI